MSSVHEEWRPVVGHERTHEVSDQGRVRSLARTIVRRVGRPFHKPEKILKGNVSKALGYQTVRLNDTLLYVHCLVLEAFVGPRPDGMEACHDPDPCRTNNCVSNLRWDTPQANQRDRSRHGTSNRGERCGTAILTEAQVREIRCSVEPGCELARRYGVAQQTICGIRKGRTWGHLENRDKAA